MERFPKTEEKDSRNWRLGKESIPSRPQNRYDQIEYWEESWRPEETCCHSDFSEKTSIKTIVKNLHRVIIIMMIMIISNISHEKTWTSLRKENLKRETESLLIAAQNNAIRTNYIKARIDKTQQNSKCRLCGDRYESIEMKIRNEKRLRLNQCE